MKRFKTTGWALALLLMVLAIGCEQVSDPLTLSSFDVARNASFNSGATMGTNRSVFYPYETIFFSYSGLYPSEQTDIQIIRLRDKQMVKRLIVITDENGEIRNLPIWYTIGHVRPGVFKDEADEYAVHLEQPGLDRPWKIYTIPFDIRNSTPPPHAQVLTVNAAGQFVAGQYITGSAVYAKGTKFGAGKNLQLLIVQDRSSYATGDPYTDVSGDGIEAVTTDGSGAFPATRIWTSAAAGSYDVVVDTEPFGQFNAGDVISDPLITGVVVQGASLTGVDLVQDIACDQGGLHKNSFATTEAVFARADAQTMPQDTWESEYIAVYITPHKEVWEHGDSLVAVRTVGTHEMPVWCLWQRNSGSLATIHARGITVSTDPMPVQLWPGKYDVIIDVDRNTVYNKGVDIIDGGSQIGFEVTGDVPGYRLVASADIDFLGCKNDMEDYWGNFKGPIDPKLYHDRGKWGWFKDRHRTMIWGEVVDSTGYLIPGAKISYTKISGPGWLDRKSATTNASGNACAVFQGSGIGQKTVVRVDADFDVLQPDGITWKHHHLTHNVVLFIKVCYYHSQGIIHNQGTVGGN